MPFASHGTMAAIAARSSSSLSGAVHSDSDADVGDEEGDEEEEEDSEVRKENTLDSARVEPRMLLLPPSLPLAAESAPVPVAVAVPTLEPVEPEPVPEPV